MSCWWVQIISILAWGAIAIPELAAQSAAQQFEELSVKDKRTVVISALEQRERSLANVAAHSSTQLYNIAFARGILGAKTKDFARYDCELRRKDGIFRADVKWFSLGGKGGDRPVESVVTSMNPATGVARSFVRHRQTAVVYGAIDVSEDRLINAGRFHFWFDLPIEKARPFDFPVRYLIEHGERIAFNGIDSEGKYVIVSLDVRQPEISFHDSRTVWLDPDKGYIPVRIRDRWEFELAAGDPLFSEVDTDVHESKLIQGVWFPWHFSDTVSGRKSVAKGYATVYETTVQSVSLDKVIESELTVDFPDGTNVDDRIHGFRYIAGGDSSPPAASKSSAWLRRWSYASVIAGVLVIVFVVFRMRRRRSRPLQ